MANGDPILIACAESDVRIGDLPLSHLAGPIIYLDPPLAAIRSAQVPLITSVHTFCLCRLKTAAHRIEHVLRSRLNVLAAAPIAALMQIASTARCKNRSAVLLSPSAFRHSCFVIRASSFSWPHCSIRLKRKAAPEKCDHRPSQKNHEIVDIKLQTSAIHVHQPKSAAKMCKRKQLGNVTNRLG